MPKFGPKSDCFMTGEALLDDLNMPEDDEGCWAARSHALGYLMGVIDAHQTLVEVERFPAVFQFPEGRTAGELNALVLERLTREPELLDSNAASLLLRMLCTEFPTGGRGAAER